MKLSRREMILGGLTLSAVVIGLTFWIGESKLKSWKQLSSEKESLREQIEKRERIISRKSLFDKRLTELQQQIPQFESKRQITPELLKGIKSIADKHDLKLPRIQPGKEKQIGDLYELHITCSWEGSLEAVTRVLFDLQSAGSRYDIAQMHVTPLSADKLKGSMEIACAYYRNGNPNKAANLEK
ncbi:hypothetical protein ACFLQY_00880 [Verrucomicrobiota bacterium]